MFIRRVLVYNQSHSNGKHTPSRHRERDKGTYMQPIQELFEDWHQLLPQQLLALFHYNGLPTGNDTCVHNRHLLAVVAPNANLTAVRDSLKALAHPLPIAPFIVREDMLAQYLMLNPALVQQLQAGDCVGNTHNLAHYPQPTESDQIAVLADQLLKASVLLMPERLQPDERHTAFATLQSLTCAFGLDENRPIQERLGHMQAIITDRYMHACPDLFADVNDETDPLPTHLPPIQAIYEEIDSALIVLPDDAADIWVNTDWEAVADHYAPTFNRFSVTTAAQLRLLASDQMAVGFGIGRYKHHWGNDILDSMIPLESILHASARYILKIGVEILPTRYLCASDNELHTVIHDVQNHLLKAQLRHDLLRLMYDLPPLEIDPLRTDRTMPLDERVCNIAHHLADWVAYYQQLLHHSAE